MFSVPQKATRRVSIPQDTRRPRVVVDPGMRGSLLHGNREVSIAVPASRGRDVVGKPGGRFCVGSLALRVSSMGFSFLPAAIVGLIGLIGWALQAPDGRTQ